MKFTTVCWVPGRGVVPGTKGARERHLARLRHSGRLPGVSGKPDSALWSEPGDKGGRRVLQVERMECAKPGGAELAIQLQVKLKLRCHPQF